MNIDVLAKIPIKPENAALCDAGNVEDIDTSYIENMTETIIKKINL